MPKSKERALRALAELRKKTRLKGYKGVSDFHGGTFDGNHVSPWTKSGCNVDADIMVVGQDWVSADAFKRYNRDSSVATEGYDPSFPTNKNLDSLLKKHFGVIRKDCYLTNLFPFIKSGHASASIPLKHLVQCATIFTLQEIRIVRPRLVICLGLRTFSALRETVGFTDKLKMAEAIAAPFDYEDAVIACVAHTGAFGMNNRGKDQVERDWRKLATRFRSRRHRR